MEMGPVVTRREIPKQLWVNPLELEKAKDVEPIPAQVTFISVLSEWRLPWWSPPPHLAEATEGVLTSSGWHDGLNHDLTPVHSTGQSRQPATQYSEKINMFHFRNNGNAGDIEYHFNAPQVCRSVYEYTALTVDPHYRCWFPRTRLLLRISKDLVQTLELVLQLIDRWGDSHPRLCPQKCFRSIHDYLSFMDHETHTGRDSYVACARFLKSQGYVPLADIEI